MGQCNPGLMAELGPASPAQRGSQQAAEESQSEWALEQTRGTQIDSSWPGVGFSPEEKAWLSWKAGQL